uniref:UDP-N-acetylenolpyruvoylglucosamine reductase n=1 Tax=Candidatus Kentrum sp. TUN TaxID=2126343 RepID=A0A450ZEV0_9GAMM|nr:MAG: UDP-N-acetylmuramate dehydrogenase [Candidatus Kentron sp. TUN]VFK52754.1 MAG: UDP-N-acetylmuramate dehydrogenase [Candidatus Kentron sp. TUN]
MHMNKYRGELRHNEPMSRYTAWGVGGMAKSFFEPIDIDDLANFLVTFPKRESIFWLGLGSNLLVRDGGVNGAVIRTFGLLNGLGESRPGVVRAEAGVSSARLARFCAKRGLGGSEFLAGIPGTVGGALAMNAGAFGNETWAIVSQVETLDRKGVRRIRKPFDFEIGYRDVRGPEDEWFVAAEFILEQESREKVEFKVQELLYRRREEQPTRIRSCGSVFRNPPGEYAGYLIDRCGLKGLRMGGAEISNKHANFILNADMATAADIEGLMNKAANIVEKKTGIRLVPEVRIIGDE